MCVPYAKTFLIVPYILITWPWTWPLAYIWTTLTLHISFLPLDIGLSYWAGMFFMTRPFRLNYQFWSHDLDCDLWPTFEQTLTLQIIDTGLSYLIKGDLFFSFTPSYFAIIHIKYHIKMSPLVPHAFLGMLLILCFSGRSEKTRWTLWPLIGWNIF